MTFITLFLNEVILINKSIFEPNRSLVKNGESININIYIYIYIYICNVGISDENDAFRGNNLGDLKLNDNQGTNAIPR